VRFRQCDDGAIAEGYRESVARILVDRWKTPQELASLTKNDKPVLSFVLKHIDATLNPDDLKKIYFNAGNLCPVGWLHLCITIDKRAVSALQ